MPIKVKHEDNIEWFEYDGEEDTAFVIKHNSGRRILIKSPLKLDPAFKDKCFEAYFLTKRGIKENEIFQVYSRELDCRIGWVIPVTALSSDLHDYASNEHFLRYAYVAMRESLKSLCNDQYCKCLHGDGSVFDFAEIFHEETVILILSKETYKGGYRFELSRAVPSLLQYGYVILSARDPDDIQHIIEIRPAETRKLYVEEMSCWLDNRDLIANLFNSSYAYESNAIFKYFYVYQVFEVLIDTIYNSEQESMIDSIVAAKGDSGKTKDALANLQSFMSEKKRIGLLIESYTTVQDKLSDLKLVCNRLLTELGRDNSDKFEGYFYTIRNFIFHQYRDFPPHCTKLLDDILEELLQVMPILLKSFAPPAGVRESKQLTLEADRQEPLKVVE